MTDTTVINHPAEPQGVETTVTDAVARKAFGADLPSPLALGPYSYLKAQGLSDVTEKELPDADQITAWVNQRRNATARNKKQAEVFEANGIEAPKLSDDEKRYNQFYNGMIAAGYSPDMAAATARQLVDNSPNKS